MVLSGLPRLQELRSISQFGLSQVTAIFADEVDVYVARQLVNERLSEVKEQLPPGVDPPRLAPISTGLGEIYYIFVEGEGMYGRMVDQGFRSPSLLGTSPPGKVVDAVIDAITRDRAETIVNPMPLRLLFAFEELVPGTGERLVTAIGTRRMFAGLARRRRPDSAP